MKTNLKQVGDSDFLDQDKISMVTPIVHRTRLKLFQKELMLQTPTPAARHRPTQKQLLHGGTSLKALDRNETVKAELSDINRASERDIDLKLGQLDLDAGESSFDDDDDDDDYDYDDGEDRT